jgi:glutathione S-transferase
MALTLVIGNKNYSSWSFRPWIAMKTAGIPFEEILVSLETKDFKTRVGAYSGSGKVPVLVDGAIKVWESLAILEYLAEKFPEKMLWPDDSAARACARTIASEMHASFGALRQHCPMNMWRPVTSRVLPEEVGANVKRIEALWTDCLSRSAGPFLFGAFGAADAMYAPVVSRFHTYGIGVGQEAQAYMARVMALPAWAEWRTAALKEPWVLPQDEPDWPTILRA